MKMKKTLHIVSFVITITTMVFIAWVYKTLPNRIITHFTVNGTPDVFADKSKLWLFTVFLLIINLVIFFSHQHIIKIHQNEGEVLENKKSWRIKRTYPILNLLITIFVSFTILFLVQINRGIIIYNRKTNIILITIFALVIITVFVINGVKYNKYIKSKTD